MVMLPVASPWVYIMTEFLYPGGFYAIIVLTPLCVGGMTLMYLTR